MMLIFFAFWEGLTNLLWSLGFAFLVIALIIASLLMWFPPVEHIAAGLARRMVSLFLASWGTSVMQGVVVAKLFQTATTGSASAVLGFAILGCFAVLIFALLAAYCFAGAVIGTVVAISHGMGDERHARQAGHLMQTGAMLAAGGVAGAATGATVKLGDAAETGLTYKAVRGMHDETGNRPSRLYAATYALGDPTRRPKLAQAGALANLMGFTLPADIEQALHTRQAAGRRDPLGPQAWRAVRRDLTPQQRTPPPPAQHGAPTGVPGSASATPPIIYAPTIQGSTINSPGAQASYTRRRPRGYQPRKKAHP
jgi:hypothetical protein